MAGAGPHPTRAVRQAAQVVLVEGAGTYRDNCPLPILGVSETLAPARSKSARVWVRFHSITATSGAGDDSWQATGGTFSSCSQPTNPTYTRSRTSANFNGAYPLY